MHAVMASFDTAVGQTSEIFQQKKQLASTLTL